MDAGVVIFWLVVWAIIGAVVTPFVYQAKGREVVQGAIVGAIVGALGGLIFLVPLWLLTPIKGDETPVKRKNEDKEAEEISETSAFSPLAKQILQYSEKPAEAFVLHDVVNEKAIMGLTEFQLAYIKEWTVEPVDSEYGWYIHQSYLEMMNRDIYALHRELDQLKDELYELGQAIEKAKKGARGISEDDYLNQKPGVKDTLMEEFFFRQNPGVGGLKPAVVQGEAASIDRLVVLAARKERLEENIKQLEWGVQQIQTLMDKLQPEFGDDDAFEVEWKAI
jgi:hypothetical protein